MYFILDGQEVPKHPNLSAFHGFSKDDVLLSAFVDDSDGQISLIVALSGEVGR